MVNAMEALFTVNDVFGIQTTWGMLLLGIIVGPLFLFVGVLRDPSVLLDVGKCRRAAFAVLWKHIAGPIDVRYAKWKAPLLSQASGVVLDLGSGLGGNLKYFNANNISKLYLVEPNTNLHAALSDNAIKAGFKEGQYQIISCGAEEAAIVEKLSGLGRESVDSVVSVLALCGIPKSRTVISALYTYLKPGGTFYFFEHIASKDAKTRTLQDYITPIWSFIFGGCCLNRQTDEWILGGFEWAQVKRHTVEIETQKNLDVKSYGWAKKQG